MKHKVIPNIHEKQRQLPKIVHIKSD
jgi:hypothetical protein